MALVTIPQGLWYGPIGPFNRAGSTPPWTHGTIGTMDAAAEKVMMFGHIYIDGRPTGTKTISSSGGKIHFRTGTVTFSGTGSPNSTLRVGIQDPQTTTVTQLTPDGTFDVYRDIVAVTDSSILSDSSDNSWISAPMGSGTKNISHGDLLCVVFDLTTRQGSDSIIITGFTADRPGMPGCGTYTTSWASSNTNSPNCIIEFDDGTLAWFDGCKYSGVITQTSESWSDSTNPDERGNIFRVPWNCYIDALSVCYDAGGAAAGDAYLYLYSNPLGTPSLLESHELLGEQDPGSLRNFHVCPLASGAKRYLSANTDYCLAIKATGSSSITVDPLEFANANYRKTTLSGTDAYYATRNWSTGSDPGTAFSGTTTKLMAYFAVRVCAIDVGIAPSMNIGGLS